MKEEETGLKCISDTGMVFCKGQVQGEVDHSEIINQ